MRPALAPVARRSLADDLAVSVRRLIESGGYRSGDRLPSIAEMAHRFGVAHPTLREALRKLETLGFLDIRHGSGVYVRDRADALLLSNPAFDGAAVPRQLLLDVLDARMTIELKAVTLAAERVTEEALARMRALLARAGERLTEPAAQAEANVAFHREIAEAAGNPVLLQLLDVLAHLVREEERVLLDSPARERFQREHEDILAALARRDADLAAQRMRAHLASVRAAILESDFNG